MTAQPQHREEPVSPQDAERDLLARLRRGDTAAAREFYDAYAQRILHFISRSLGGSPHDAEDVLQETFMALAEALPFFRGDSSLFTFACAIAHRKVLSFIRASSRRARLSDAIPQEPVALDEPSGAGAMRAALAMVTREHREVLFLKYVEDLSVADIAAALSCSEHAIESRLARARRSLKKILESKR